MVLLSSTSPDAAAMPSTDPVKDSDASTFVADVVQGSQSVPVIVDFWAPWCGPCKQLTPVLERLVRAMKGAVRLVKVNIDENPQIAQQMRVQSVPAVFAFFQGRPIDGFMGAQPDAQLKQWIERLVKATGAATDGNPLAELDKAFEQAEAFLAEGDLTTAQAVYADILDMDPGNAAAYAGLVRCLLAGGETAQAKQMLEDAPAELAKDKAFDSVRAALDLAEQAAKVGPVGDLEAKIAVNPKDHQARFDLAMALLAKGERERAADLLLDIVRMDRGWDEDGARRQLVKLFEAWGATDPLTIDVRRRLSTVLFS